MAVVERIKLREGFFSAPPGSTLKLRPDARMMQICDGCGHKTYCEWYEWDPELPGMTGMDICDKCAKFLEVKE